MNDYDALKQRLATGWNTWNTRSVLSHVELPSGFAINLGLKQFQHTSTLREALIARADQREEVVRPGMRSYDGAYTELTLSWKDLEVRVQSATDRDDLVLLVTPLASQKKAPLLVVEAGILWGQPGYVVREGDALVGHVPENTICVYATGADTHDPYIAALTSYFTIALEGPVGVSTGSPRSLEVIQTIVQHARERELARVAAFGEHAEVYEAVQTCLAWDTIYEPAKGRVVSPVSRVFNSWKDGYILFCWDAYFAAYMAGIDNRDLAYANAIEITREKTAAGFVPNYAQAGGIASLDRSQPPVGSWVIRELYRRYRDKWLLEEVFDDLLTWNRWWPAHRCVDGLLAWGSNPFEPVADMYWESAGVNDTFGGALESGLDNSPMYDDVPFDTERHVMKLADVGLNGLYVMDCNALADIAAVLGRSVEERELRERATTFSKAVNGLWDEVAGIYFNRQTDRGQPSSRVSPTNFYPLLGRCATPAQATRMVQEHFYNSDEFWGDWIMPSISRDDPGYADQTYWRGRIWPPMNFLVYVGLRNYDTPEARADLARISRDLFLKGWRKDRYVCENYSPITGEGGEEGASSDRFYHWGGLLGMIALIESGAIGAPESAL